MLGLRQAGPMTLQNFYGAFQYNFPTGAQRLTAARTLIPGTGENPVWMHPSRSVLATQWGDTLNESLETAKLLYSLPTTLAKYAGQRVVQLDNFTTFKDIHRIKHGDPLPEFGLSVDIGTIDGQAQLEYGFRATPKAQRPVDANPRSPYLDFQVTFPVELNTRLDMDRTGQLDVYEPPRPVTIDFVAYSGTVCLGDELAEYRKTRTTRVGNLAFGTDRAMGVAYDIQRTGETAPFRTTL